MRSVLFSIAMVLSLCVAGVASAQCEDKFDGARAPALTNSRLAARTAPLCFEGFAVLSSGVTRTPLWSAEHLTANTVQAARMLSRVNAFHAEDALADADRAELSDYRGSGFDRGHMSPSGDMGTETAQHQSFTLANMVPQAPALNRGLWEEIESTVRDLAVRDGEVYVVTGPIFQGGSLQALNGRVMVPTSVYKAIYDPARGLIGAYLAQNIDGGGYQVISIAQLRDLTGVDVFPALPETFKGRVMALPAPSRHEGPGAVVTNRAEPSTASIIRF